MLQLNRRGEICLAVRMRHRLVDQSARAEIRLQNQGGSLLNTMILQWPGNLACKDKDVRRDRRK
jgi:hypothetical protein